jgi:hypothetical protein
MAKSDEPSSTSNEIAGFRVQLSIITAGRRVGALKSGYAVKDIRIL